MSLVGYGPVRPKMTKHELIDQIARRLAEQSWRVVHVARQALIEIIETPDIVYDQFSQHIDAEFDDQEHFFILRIPARKKPAPSQASTAPEEVRRP